MAYIPEVSEQQADAGLRRLYDQIRQEFGFVPHFWQAQGSRPDVVEASLQLWRSLYQQGVLPRELKEKIGLVVSAANSDSYCIRTHMELLRRMGVSEDISQQLVLDHEAADAPENEKALFRFAKKLTLTPFEVKEADVSELRRQGWDNAAILEVALVVSHFNFLNRMAAALGVVPEAV